MNYKKIIKSQKLRIKMLELLKFISDNRIIKIQYRIAFNRSLNLKNPQRFTEKIQWYKLNYRSALMTICADKYEVRQYIVNKGFEDILVPIIGVYDSVEEIDLEDFPNKFVLKTTNGSHTNLFCEDKKQFDFEKEKFKLDEWQKRHKISPGREWAYHDIKARIICESYIEKDKNNDLIDYKFFCFNGKVYCLYVIVDRFLESGPKLAIYDRNFKKMNCYRDDIPPLRNNISKPENFDRMVNISEELSKEFPHVRVDLYNVDGKIMFGELTFYDGSGYKGFNPDSFDYELGTMFELPNGGDIN